MFFLSIFLLEAIGPWQVQAMLNLPHKSCQTAQLTSLSPTGQIVLCGAHTRGVMEGLGRIYSVG